MELCRDDGFSPLSIAAQENHVEIVRLLIDAKANPLHKTDAGHEPQYLTSNQDIFKLLKAVLPDDGQGQAPVSNNQFGTWLWGKAVEHNKNMVTETLVEFFDKIAPGHGDALDEVGTSQFLRHDYRSFVCSRKTCMCVLKALDEYDVDVPATLDSFMHLFGVINWTESAVDTMRHWTQQEDCGTIFFYNTLTHVSTYDNPFQVGQNSTRVAKRRLLNFDSL